MTPLQIELLLRLRTHVYPFEGYTPSQVYSPAVAEAFELFRMYGLIRSDLNVYTPWDCAPCEVRLTWQGINLLNQLCQVQP